MSGPSPVSPGGGDGTNALRAVSRYPELIRNQWHGNHDYTLRLSDNVDVRLSPQQLISMGKQIEQDQSPIDAEQLARMKAELAGIRSFRAVSSLPTTTKEQQP